VAEVRKAGSVARTLATFIHGLSYEDLPEGVRELAKTRLLDALASAYAGRDLPHCRAAIEVIKESKGEATVFGHDLKVAVTDAALANGVLAHSTFFEDMILGGAHPSTIVIPAAVAVGEQERASGREAVVAIVLGYELMGRIFRALGGLAGFAMPAFRPGTVVGTFGAAATAGRLMKLSEEQLTHTLGYAAALTPGTPGECWWGGTMEGMFQAGMSAQTGILAAHLARAGATTAPQALEGRHGFLRCWAGAVDKAGLATDDLGKTFVISRTAIKPFPACGANQLPIQVALPLAKHSLKAKDINSIREKLPPGATSYAGNNFAGPFASHFQAGMSLQFCAAATILGRPVTSFRFFAEHYDDPEVTEVARKVELACEEGRTRPRFEVYTGDGKVYVSEETPDRTIHRPTRKNMEEKFRALAAESLSRERIEQIIDLVMNLEQLDDLRKLTARLGK